MSQSLSTPMLPPLSASVIVTKVIKPSALREDKMRFALLNGMRKVMRGILKDFKETVATWEIQPKFETKISLRLATGPEVFVWTDNRIYSFVNEGTNVGKAPYPIFAGAYTGKSSAKALSFIWGGKGSYMPKTSPGVIGSKKGGKTGDPYATAYVQHPGIQEPRKFDEAIAKKWDPRFKREMEATMREVRRVSDHAI